jgi:hypothetical protein
VASTRKTGRVASSVLDGLAAKLSRHPVPAVLAGARIYLDRGCAEERKDENYLTGIVRREASRASLNGNGHHPTMPAKTEGQSLIERTARQMVAEQEAR